MAGARRGSKVLAVSLVLVASCLLKSTLNFSFTKGAVNLGVDGKIVESKNMPKPVLQANEATNLAIQDCLKEGCSVDALMGLDGKLADDEAKLQIELDPQ